MNDPVLLVIVDWMGTAAKYAGFIALMGYLIRMLIRAATGKSRFI